AMTMLPTCSLSLSGRPLGNRGASRSTFRDIDGGFAAYPLHLLRPLRAKCPLCLVRRPRALGSALRRSSAGHEAAWNDSRSDICDAVALRRHADTKECSYDRSRLKALASGVAAAQGPQDPERRLR